MVNVDKLFGKIREKRKSVVSVAHAAGMNPSTFYRKANSGGADFSIRQVDAIVKYLGLTAIESVEIFFAQNVA